MPRTANNKHHQSWILLAAETLFYERDQALRAEEIVECGAEDNPVRDV